MVDTLDATRSFGFTRMTCSRALEVVAQNRNLRSLRGPRLASQLGLGTVQLEALGAWMRFAALIRCETDYIILSPLGTVVRRNDPALNSPISWWAIHWQLASNYAVW
ncbi:MAG: DUF4007 family protein [Candidatus Zipacnadales bacterium]